MFWNASKKCKKSIIQLPAPSVPFPYSFHMSISDKDDVLECSACYSKYAFHIVTGEQNGAYYYSRFGNFCFLVAGPWQMFPKVKSELDYMFNVHSGIFRRFTPWSTSGCPYCASASIAITKAAGGRCYTLSF